MPLTLQIFHKGVKPALHCRHLHGQNVLLHGQNVAQTGCFSDFPCHFVPLQYYQLQNEVFKSQLLNSTDFKKK